jgi:hypothetical protein
MIPPNLRIGLQDRLPLLRQAGGVPAQGRGPSNKVFRPPVAVASPLPLRSVVISAYAREQSRPSGDCGACGAHPLIDQCPCGLAAEAESPLIIAVTNGKVLLLASRSDGAGHDLLPTNRPCSKSPQIHGPGPTPWEAPCMVPRVSLVMLIASMVPSPASPRKFSAFPYCAQRNSTDQGGQHGSAFENGSMRHRTSKQHPAL